MNKMELENAIKSIFMQCLNEPDILEAIRDKINYAGNAWDCEENQIQQPHHYFNESNNAVNTVLIEKLDEILKYQKAMEAFIKSEADKRTKKSDELSTELKNYQEQNSNLIAENENLKNKTIQLTTENKNMEEKCRIEVSKYAIFEETLEVWNCINTLKDADRGYIENLCGSLDVLAILSLGRDDGKIEQLWLYLRDMAVKGDAEKIEVSKLNRYFEFCLKVANASKLENEKYVMLDIEPEREFDIDTCIRTNDSRQFGKIKDIVVRSFKTGKDIKYKAIVRVR